MPYLLEVPDDDDCLSADAAAVAVPLLAALAA